MGSTYPNCCYFVADANTLFGFLLEITPYFISLDHFVSFFVVLEYCLSFWHYLQDFIFVFKIFLNSFRILFLILWHEAKYKLKVLFCISLFTYLLNFSLSRRNYLDCSCAINFYFLISMLFNFSTVFSQLMMIRYAI